MKDEDADVVRAVKAGETDAFRILIDRYKKRLFGIIVRLVGDSETAEELVQNTFVKAYLGLPAFRGEARFSTWLVQIGLHTTRDHERRARRCRVVSLDALDEEHRWGAALADRRPGADPAVEVETREELAFVRRALADLPHAYREILVLRHAEELSYEEISRLTGDTVGTLKVRAHRARKHLAQCLSELRDRTYNGFAPPVKHGGEKTRRNRQ